MVIPAQVVERESLWMVSLETASAPKEVPPESPAEVAQERVVLCQDGTAMDLAPKDAKLTWQIEKRPPLLITVTSPKGEPAPDIPLVWRPEPLPNLPTPFGKVKTNRLGTATIFPPKDSATVVWIDDPLYESGLTKAAAGKGVASLSLVPYSASSVAVRDVFGRCIDKAELVLFPGGAPKGPFGYFRDEEPKSARLRSDTSGRIKLPEKNERSAGWLSAFGYQTQTLTQLKRGSNVIALTPAPIAELQVFDQATGLPVSTVHARTAWSPQGTSWIRVEAGIRLGRAAKAPPFAVSAVHRVYFSRGLCPGDHPLRESAIL